MSNGGSRRRNPGGRQARPAQESAHARSRLLGCRRAGLDGDPECHGSRVCVRCPLRVRPRGACGAARGVSLQRHHVTGRERGIRVPVSALDRLSLRASHLPAARGRRDDCDRAGRGMRSGGAAPPRRARLALLRGRLPVGADDRRSPEREPDPADDARPGGHLALPGPASARRSAQWIPRRAQGVLLALARVARRHPPLSGSGDRRSGLRRVYVPAVGEHRLRRSPRLPAPALDCVAARRCRELLARCARPLPRPELDGCRRGRDSGRGRRASVRVARLDVAAATATRLLSPSSPSSLSRPCSRSTTSPC